MYDLLIKAKVMIMVKHIQCTSVDSREMPNDPLSVSHCLTLLSPAPGNRVGTLVFSEKPPPYLLYLPVIGGGGTKFVTE